MSPLMQRLVAEAVGTAFLLMAVVGSGIMAQRLSPGDVGLQLFRERGGNGVRADGAHLGVRPDFGGALQPGGHAGGHGIAGPAG